MIVSLGNLTDKCCFLPFTFSVKIYADEVYFPNFDNCVRNWISCVLVVCWVSPERLSLRRSQKGVPIQKQYDKEFIVLQFLKNTWALYLNFYFFVCNGFDIFQHCIEILLSEKIFLFTLSLYFIFTKTRENYQKQFKSIEIGWIFPIWFTSLLQSCYKNMRCLKLQVKTS